MNPAEHLDFKSIEPVRDMRGLVGLAKLIGSVRGPKREIGRAHV